MKSNHFCEKNKTIIELLNLEKVYKVNGAHALKGMGLNVKCGTVHSLIGENGAGKTTLMKILCGIEKEDEGIIRIRGKDVRINNPVDSYNLGIGMIYQHFRLIDDFTVTENVLLGNESNFEKLFISKKKRRKTVEKLLSETDLNLDADARISDLSVGEKQIVEILRVLCRGADILIFDEPTAVLGESETRKLFGIIRKLKENGKTIIFISHKLKEVEEISDEITVMKEGRALFSGNFKNADLDYMRNLTGTDVLESEDEIVGNEDVLIVKKLEFKGQDKKTSISGINLNVKKGEILGITGMPGNGQNVLAEIIFGIRRRYSGEILFKGLDIWNMDIRERRKMGMRYVPEDRLKEGVSLESSIEENLIADKIHGKAFALGRKLGLFNLMDYGRIRRYSSSLAGDFGIKSSSVRMPAGMLSGGNIQKVVLARELSSDSEFVMVCEPTRGLDISSTNFVYEKITEMKKKGLAVLLISSNLDEICRLSDRLTVIYEGRISEFFVNGEKLDINRVRRKIAGYA